MEFLKIAILAMSFVGAVSCTTKDDTHVSDAIATLVGQPLEKAIKVFGPANRTIIENRKSVSYWLKVDIEHYAGLSNRREISTIDGRRVETTTEGMKMKVHRSDCVIKIESNENSIITSSVALGNPKGCVEASETLS